MRLRLRRRIIWVLAFLIVPGVSVSTRFGANYQLPRVYAPERADGLLLMVTRRSSATLAGR